MKEADTYCVSRAQTELSIPIYPCQESMQGLEQVCIRKHKTLAFFVDVGIFSSVLDILMFDCYFDQAVFYNYVLFIENCQRLLT